MPACPAVCLSVCLSLCLSVCLSVCLSAAYLSLRLCLCLSIWRSVSFRSFFFFSRLFVFFCSCFFVFLCSSVRAIFLGFAWLLLVYLDFSLFRVYFSYFVLNPFFLFYLAVFVGLNFPPPPPLFCLSCHLEKHTPTTTWTMPTILRVLLDKGNTNVAAKNKNKQTPAEVAYRQVRANWSGNIYLTPRVCSVWHVPRYTAGIIGTGQFDNFGTTSIPVQDNSVASVRHQYRYRTLR